MEGDGAGEGRERREEVGRGEMLGNELEGVMNDIGKISEGVKGFAI